MIFIENLFSSKDLFSVIPNMFKTILSFFSYPFTLGVNSIIHTKVEISLPLIN